MSESRRIKRLQENFDYFDNVRKQLLDTLAIKVIYHWRKYKKVKARL